MNDIDYTWVTAGGILLAYSIVILIFAGEKYMRWYCRHMCNFNRNNIGTLKKIHVTALFVLSFSIIAVGLFTDIFKPRSLVFCILTTMILLQDLLFWFVSKKKKPQKKSEE